jgi:8-oxo-dGTP diphosphatase
MPELPAGPEIRAAGAVLWRAAEQGAEVVLVHRPRYDDWSFPKGKRLKGEHLLVTAVREVAEETGIRVVLRRRLRPVRYLRGGRPKRVDYWAARPAAGEGTRDGFVPGDEVDRLEWLALPAARERLTYPHDLQVLDDFASGPFAAGPADTVPHILLRHASAGDKAAWRRDDLLRPLDERGSADAEILADLLACFAPSEVISSAAERCMATVRPYAARAGRAVRVEPAFTLRDADVSPEATRRLAELVSAGVPFVLCGHGEMIPPLLEHACGRPAAGGPGAAQGRLLGHARRPSHPDRRRTPPRLPAT